MADPMKPTPYDEMMQTRELQMLKTIVPFLEHQQQQQQLAFFIQYMEMRNTISAFSNHSNALAACEIPQGMDRRSAMLSALREYCTPKEKDTIDTILNLFCILDNYESLLV